MLLVCEGRSHLLNRSVAWCTTAKCKVLVTSVKYMLVGTDVLSVVYLHALFTPSRMTECPTRVSMC